MSDQELYEQAMERMKKAGMTSSGLSSRIENVIFLEKEIEDYRRKLDYAESRIQALCAEQTRIIQLEQRLIKEREELNKPSTFEATIAHDGEIYKKAINRARNSQVNVSSGFDVIVFLEKEIDMYRDKIAKLLDEKQEMMKTRLNTSCVSQLEAVQKNMVGEIIKALSDNGFKTITINCYKE